MANVLVISGVDYPALGGMNLVEVPCGFSALEAMLCRRPDLLVCPERIPGFDGADLLSVLRGDKTFQDLPVVVLSESGDARAKFFQLGCDDYIVLPVDASELQARLERNIKRSVPSGLSGDFTIITLLDLLQLFISARSNGVLEVSHGELLGKIFFNDGQIAHASIGNISGESALTKLLRDLRQGSFVFTMSKGGEPKPTITKRSDHLLLALASSLDEVGDEEAPGAERKQAAKAAA